MQAIPAEATNVSVHSHEAAWHGPQCSPAPTFAGRPLFQPGPAGWSAVAVWASFDDAEPVAAVINRVDAVLKHLSWRRHDLHNRAYPDIPAWTKSVGKDRPAQVILGVITPTGSYSLDAEWHPPGYSEVGCLVG